jgi:hypothetical protein
MEDKLRLCDGVLREKVATATQEIFMEGGECSDVVLLGSLGGDRTGRERNEMTR